MNLEDFKHMWDNEQSGEVKLPADLTKVKNAQAPLDKIRRNMKGELYAQVIAMVLFGLFPYHFDFRDELIPPFFAMYAVMIAISAYYLLMYYFLYKQFSNTSLTSRDHLYSLYSDIRVNMEVYKAFSYSLIPFLLIFIGMVILNKKPDLEFSSRSLYIAILLYVVITVLIGLATSAWVNTFYGKYARQIKGLIDELKDE